MDMEIQPPAGERRSVEGVRAALPQRQTTDVDDGALRVSLLSFGFKYGQPHANHVFDVSFLTNPARQEGWSLWSEPCDEMRNWVIAQPAAQAFLSAVLPAIKTLAQLDDGARFAFGCSAGRHRSTILVDEVAYLLRAEGIEVFTHHRERHAGATTRP